MLPRLPNKDQIKKAQTVQFSGLNKNPGAVDGTLWDTINMGSDRMPCLSPRKRRWQVGQFKDCCGMYPYNGLYLVLGTDIQKDGVSIGTASNTERKMFAAMNKQLGNGLTAEAQEDYAKAVTAGAPASACIGCKQCEQACPQHLTITEYLEQAAQMLE